MKRALVVILLLLVRVIGMMPMMSLDTETTSESTADSRLPLIEDSGEKSSVSVRFDRELTGEDIYYYESLGVSFGESLQHIGPIYIDTPVIVIIYYICTGQW